jgi:chromosome segregation ATPase
MEVKRTPELIGSEIRMYYEAGRRVTMLCGIEIGRRLVEAKDLMQHGEFLPWLTRETPFSERHAQNYMKIYREYGTQMGLLEAETNAKYIADLPISKALLLLSVPESERDEFAESVDAEHLNSEELKKAIRERDEAIARAKAAEEELAQTDEGHQLAIGELEEKIAAMKKDAEAGREAKIEHNKLLDELEAARLSLEGAKQEIKELESRPQTVAVQRDEKAIEEAAATAAARATAKAAEEIASLQKKLEKAEKAREKAEKAGSGAGEEIAAAKAEAARAKEELKTAKKKLLAADKDVAEVGVYIRQLQLDLNEIQARIRKIRERDNELAEKLQAAFRSLLAPHMEV